MNCPYCKATIDDDSLYCDQCAGEILVCSACGRPGKGKRCIDDGKPMQKPTGATVSTAPLANASASHSTSEPTIYQAGTTAKPAAVAVDSSPRAQAAATSKVTKTTPHSHQLRLINRIHGIDIQPISGNIIGRVNGDFTDHFGRFPQVSGTHLRLDLTPTGWTAMDLGSTNGTLWNNQALQAQVAIPLFDGGILTIADIEIEVKIGPAQDNGGKI